jgi:hemerythrin
MPREWTPDLSVGVDSIDGQHKELFKRINSLLEAMKAGKGKQIIAETLSFLKQYAAVHFADEEKLMQKIKFPEINMHKMAHQAFVKDFTALADKLGKEGASAAIIVETQQKLMDWLINHIGKMDKKYGEFIKANNITI